jgi:hypothetical protein
VGGTEQAAVGALAPGRELLGTFVTSRDADLDKVVMQLAQPP